MKLYGLSLDTRKGNASGKALGDENAMGRSYFNDTWFTLNRNVNATKSYLHFSHFAGNATLCSNVFCFLLFLSVFFLS